MVPPQAGRLLIVDDEVELRLALCETLSEQGYETTGASGGEEALAALQTQEFDLLLSDLMMPGLSGIDLLRQALEIDPNLVGIIMTGQGSIPTAVEAMKVGALDYVLKPFNLQTMLPILARAMDVRRLRLENIRLRHYVEKLSYESPRYHMIGSGPAMDRVAQLIAKVAPTDATVLICGRSGTGKEIVAHAVHSNSLRRNRPMVTINCAALQENLLESELFGHEKGAFTGAQQSKLGLIEVAEGGTLFIDEVAEMAPSLQAKLLRVLEDGHYRRVGSTKECHADVRIIAATNKPLDQEQRAGRFREDLYFRLNVVTIELPPLCERRQDIPALAEHFLAHRQIGPKPCRLDPKALEALMQYHWPGNIRELANVLERAQILAQDHVITTDDLPETIFVAPLPRSTPSTPSPPPGQSAAPPGASRPAADTTGLDTLNLSDLECRAIQTALLRSKGNKAHAAKALGISRRALYRLISRYGLEDAGPPEAARPGSHD